MSIPDTPVWSWAPNWADAVVERWEWLTDVEAGDSGVEQRIAARYAPRRSVEAQFLVTGSEAAYLHLALQRAGTTRWLVPLWFHGARLTTAAISGATTLAADTVDREFDGGDYALLVGADAFTSEVVEISAVASGSLTLAAGTAAAWAAGSRLYPLREGFIEVKDSSAPSDLVARVGLRATFEQGNAEGGGSETLDLFEGTPLLVHSPDWAQGLDREFEWLAVDLDSATGPIYRTDPTDRAFQTVRYGIQLHGRTEQAAFRALLRRLRGRQGNVWIPAHVNDLRVAAAAATGAGALEIDRIGLGDLGGVTEDVATILLSRNLPLRATGLTTPSSAAREKLTLSGTLPRDVAEGERGCFLHFARLDQDAVTITHRTDSDGVATVPLAWRAVPDTRDGSADGFYPIPTAEMTEGGCCDDETPPTGSGVVLDFENGIYTIDGVAKTLTECVEANGSDYTTADVIPGTGLFCDTFDYIGPALTAEAFAAVTSGSGFSFTIDFTLSTDGLAGAGDGSYVQVFTNPDAFTVGSPVWGFSAEWDADPANVSYVYDEFGGITGGALVALSGNGDHAAEVSFTAAQLTGAIDGGASGTIVTPQTPTITSITISPGVAGGATPHGAATIRRIEFTAL